jgi:two-component system OmpR family sensor kinase
MVRPLSLRSRLVLATVLLAALGMVVVSAATLLALPLYFGIIADSQLLRLRDVVVQQAVSPGAVLDIARQSSTSSGTLFARLVDESGRTLAEATARNLDGEPLVDPAVPEPLPAGFATAPTTLSASGGAYRVIAVDLVADGPGSAHRAVLAQSLAPSRIVVYWLLVFEATVVVIALLGVLLISRKVLGVGLRPLQAMADTANAIASGETDQRLATSARHTEIDDLGRALNRAFDARRRSEDKLRRFVADASHELRTPLTTIRGWAQLQLHGLIVDRATIEQGTRRIEKEAARMHRMVEDLLLLARLDQDRPLATAPVDLSRLAEDAVADLRAAHPGRRATVDAPDRLFTEGDDDRLAQMLGNLLANAVQHTPPETSIRVTVRDAPPDRVALVVADDGPGMSPATRDRAFERFYRDEGARRGAGAGLGLSIVSAIAAAHGGEVGVTSAPGAGTAVTVRLPTPH